MCVMLKEEDFDLTFDEILEKLQNETEDNYHVKALKEAEVDFMKLEAMSDEEWKEMMTKVNKEIEKKNDDSRQEALKLKELHARTERELIQVINSTKDEITQNVCRFGLEQLEAVKYDCEPHLSELHSDVLLYKTNGLERAVRSIQYHKKNMGKADEHEIGRIESFIKVRDEVDRILG